MYGKDDSNNMSDAFYGCFLHSNTLWQEDRNWSGLACFSLLWGTCMNREEGGGGGGGGGGWHADQHATKLTLPSAICPIDPPATSSILFNQLVNCFILHISAVEWGQVILQIIKPIQTQLAPVTQALDTKRQIDSSNPLQFEWGSSLAISHGSNPCHGMMNE